jgi:hypothetical protein
MLVILLHLLITPATAQQFQSYNVHTPGRPDTYVFSTGDGGYKTNTPGLMSTTIRPIAPGSDNYIVHTPGRPDTTINSNEGRIR